MPPVGKIASLPKRHREWLRKAIVEHQFGDTTALKEELNELLKKDGVPVSVGRSAVGEEIRRVRRASEAIRATTEAAKIIAETSADPGDTRSEATMALIQSETFKLMLAVSEVGDEDDPAARLKLMANVAKSAATVSRARVNQAKWRDELDARAKAAAERVAKLAKKGGASAETIREIREQILGITKRGPDAASAAA